ncbi:MAG: nuclear transport factor 2 family protein [Pseudomonadota bacterium]
MTAIADLVETYVRCYNNSDGEGMLACCAPDVVFETISNPGGSLRLTGHAEMREVLDASTRAFTERSHRIVSLLSEGDRAAAETVFTGVAAAELGDGVRPGDNVSIRGATLFEIADGKFARITDYS